MRVSLHLYFKFNFTKFCSETTLSETTLKGHGLVLLCLVVIIIMKLHLSCIISFAIDFPVCFCQSVRDVDAGKGFILNKGTQVVTLIFVNDYPEKVW